MQCTKPRGNGLCRAIEDHTYRSLVCSAHFSDADYTVQSPLSTKRKLNHRAVPHACLCSATAAAVTPPTATHTGICTTAPRTEPLTNNNGRDMGLASLVDPTQIEPDAHIGRLLAENEKLRQQLQNLSAAVVSNVHKKVVYSNSHRHFACKAKHISSAAYRFLRTKMRLPSPRAIRYWLPRYQVTPGITEQSTLELSTRLHSNHWQYTLCSLIMDEMDIKKKIETTSCGWGISGYATTIADSGEVLMGPRSKLYKSSSANGRCFAIVY
jgi:hypothetical protein